jgi:hypothetical protein
MPGLVNPANHHSASIIVFTPLFLDNIFLGNWQIFGDTAFGQTT